MKEKGNINRQNSTEYSAKLPKALLFVLIALFGVYFAFFSSFIIDKAQHSLIAVSQSYSQTHFQYLTPAQQYYTSNNDLSTPISLLDHPSYINSDRNDVDTTDPRTIAMYNFLTDYSSPMASDAESFIVEADKYGLDWRLVASISGVESAFGRITPTNSYNGWGWKGDPTKEWSEFDTWEHAIATVTKGLALGYGINKTPYQIESTYCPPCGANPAHAWANGVQSYMNSLNIYLAEVKE